MNKPTLPADVRQVIVAQLGAALAEAWRRQQGIPHTNDERPARGPVATGRDVRGEGGREHHDSNTP